jgi:uncharacterized protein (DUF1501 family)
LVQGRGRQFRDTTIAAMSDFGCAVSENGKRVRIMSLARRCSDWAVACYGRMLIQYSGLKERSFYEGANLAVTINFRSIRTWIAEPHLRWEKQVLETIFPEVQCGAGWLECAADEKRGLM